ncbi:hypothetical protein McpSp1_07230 [Methanocorpusculaceae archaeon Sp1]|uniref:CopG family transcriptional regulator n=1 Tax=Methanorbis furvi TaxID=3028299 RepID=A0AAE4SAY2_9EURY|nr:hypothetical protein [Methanocorpusculaceae archaeon Sp1]MDV0442444.1 hypothetical protein [Methanocorpusculaceae archaeon Ag1]
MIVMAAAKRLCKKPTSYKLPVDIEVLLHNAVESGEYNNTSDVITAALRFFFQHKDIKQVKDDMELLKVDIRELNMMNQILERQMADLEAQIKVLQSRR